MNRTTIKDCQLINIPKVHDERGSLGVIEKSIIPFSMKRVYYLYDVPNDSFRGGHAHRKQESIIIALSGSFEVVLNDGNAKKKIALNKPNQALYIPKGIWREIENFSSGSVCLVIASTEFSEDDYIREYETYKSFKG
ncbi:FdtA/QdtA family cupin domain-containing protein [uncultured Winogradskyella sp.]|uniref:sugar 3,4-ketoisomerase n=1 Tax=uncultured Winogradskyella sp. TaxID=395353 RepID=UPI0030DB7983|tara:strand:+ start:560 stop:970 length:411 start_codon:yes stop_codon:yes gene_type:complete